MCSQLFLFRINGVCNLLPLFSSSFRIGIAEYGGCPVVRVQSRSSFDVDLEATSNSSYPAAWEHFLSSCEKEEGNVAN